MLRRLCFPSALGRALLYLTVPASNLTVSTYCLACRYEYHGPSVDLARAAVHACPGGVVFLSESCYGQLSVQQLPTTASVVNMGEYVLVGAPQPQQIYCASDRALMYRCAPM